MPAPIKITLSDNDRERLEKNIRSLSTPKRLIERSKIIVLAADGVPNYKICETLNTNHITVARWRNRFAEQGISCLEKELPRGANQAGKSTIDQQKLRSKVIKITIEEKPKDARHWSTRSLARHLGINHSFINRVWREVGLKPHLDETCKVSKDPHFEQKLKDVVGLYLSPPENAVIFCVDEKNSIQALDRTRPGLPLKPSRSETMTHDYNRNSTSNLAEALNTLTGEVIGDCTQKQPHQGFLAFLKDVEKETPKEYDLHLIVDNYATHTHEKIKIWIRRNKRVTLHFIPTRSSWLNLVERFFRVLSEKQLKHGAFTSVKELDEKIMAFIVQHNKDKNPFAWTKPAEEILKNLDRTRKTISLYTFV